ncbi:DUF2484 family protein [Paracoccus sp. p4-l81]|uniref:DUF2484 family protein n=1 Tax=Paracoccus sp. p4-l81 TaxID=3342806 RepID=UPI0035B8E650
MSIALILTPLWLIAAAALPRVPLRLRAATSWSLSLIGVPLLGGLTYAHGLLTGLTALALGAALLALAFRPHRGHAAE